MIDGVPIVGLTAPTLVGLFVLLIFTGMLIPRRIYKDKQAESDQWRTAFETEREARQVADKQTADLLEAHKVTHEVLKAIFRNSEALLKSRGDDVAS